MLISLAFAVMLMSESVRPSPPRRLADLRTPIQPVAMPQPRGLPSANSHALAILLVERLRADVEAAEEKFGEVAPALKPLREHLSTVRSRVDQYQADIDRLEDPTRRDAAERALDNALISGREDLARGRRASSTGAALERELLLEDLKRRLEVKQLKK